jgi:RNA polymerase sigma-70 factor (ECF subfamily)
MSEPAFTGDVDPGPQPGEHTSVLEAPLSQAVAGSASARAELLSVLRPMVLHYCRGRLGRQETGLLSAEDVAQDVCLAVVNALPTYQITERSFRAFVYGIAAHKVADTFRAIARNRVEPVAEIPDAPLPRGGPEEHALDVELASVVNGLLQLLPRRHREVLLLRIVAGLSAEETARVLGSTPGAIRVTQHRALNFLRAQVTTS